ncbi:MAG: hypothetical protein CL910_10420 [Deltaproteobacteria bacterium]|nr:hypothetical protein [Deltaproteobacteria bacterium]
MDEVTARILYWGIEGAGKRTNLETIHAKLRPDNRGEIEEHGTRIDPSTTYHELPIELGNLGGVRTRLRLVAPPTAPEQQPTRRQLLDRVDGIVFVVDTQREQLDLNLACLEELRSLLGDYGRSLETVPLVFQYNKRDLSDPYALDELHRKFELRGVAAFEAVATEGTGVLQTLTTISKRVVRHLREHGRASEPEEVPVIETDPLGLPEEPELAAEVQDDPVPTEGLAAELLLPEEEAGDEILETTMLAEASFEDSFQEVTEAAGMPSTPFEDVTELPAASSAPAADAHFEIVRAGVPQVLSPRSLSVPLVLRDETGRERELTLTLGLDLGGEG